MNDDIIELKNALIIPPEEDERGRYNGRSGVYTEDGEFVSASLSTSSGRLLHQKPLEKNPKRKEETYLEGRHAFGGVFFGHFGHFITESTGRLWILGEPDINLDSIVYAPKEDKFRPQTIERQTGLLAAIGITARLQVVDGPTRVERLYVPRQEFGLDPELIRGTPRYVDFMRRSASNVKPEGGELLYISREGLAFDRGTILGEKFLVSWLEKEGYTIYKPQKHSLQEQAAQYRAAKKIISVDASPLHFLSYVAHPDQKISIIKRRSMDAISNIVSHLESFGSPSIQVIDHIKANYVSKTLTKIGRTSWSEVSFRDIGRDLRASGMISDASDWRDLTEAEFAEQIHDIGVAAKCIYSRIPVEVAEALAS